jgi:beta-glucosidase-like glycosyl hydrolase
MADGRGIKIEDLGVPLGACASVWRAAEETLLDCQIVRAWRPKLPLKNDDELQVVQQHQPSCQQLPLAALPYCKSSNSMDERADDLLARLNTSELVSQMQGTTPAAIPRLGLTEVTFGGEALHGVVARCINASGTRRCPTQFPAPLALGATFSKQLFRAVGTAISVEARALYNFGCPTCPPGKQAWGVEGPLFLAFYAPVGRQQLHQNLLV